MSYSIKEIYYTIQGEGVHTGRPAVFIRFSGCNLWSGREEDRASAVCKFCDTDFVGTGASGGVFSIPAEIIRIVQKLWPASLESSPFVVCTGGEPLLQLDQSMVNAFHNAGFEIAIETNGTLKTPGGIDWTCVSPKAGTDLQITRGDELKIVFPQENMSPLDYASLEFEHFLIQPLEGPELQTNTQKALDFCLNHPQWRLSLQIHKILHIP